jgi:hypothetical protein
VTLEEAIATLRRLDDDLRVVEDDKELKALAGLIPLGSMPEAEGDPMGELSDPDWHLWLESVRTIQRESPR